MKIVDRYKVFAPNEEFFLVEHAGQVHQFRQDPVRPVRTGDMVLLLWDDKTHRLTRPKQVQPNRA